MPADSSGHVRSLGGGDPARRRLVRVSGWPVARQVPSRETPGSLENSESVNGSTIDGGARLGAVLAEDCVYDQAGRRAPFAKLTILTAFPLSELAKPRRK